MIKSDLQIEASDGFRLHAHLFIPDIPNDVFILFNNATAIVQRYYHPYASYLCEHGYSCLTWDYRNTGSSIDSTQDSQGGLLEWGNYDLSGVLQYIQRTYPDQKILIIAHSIGGVLPALSAEHSSIKGMIAVGVQSAYWKDWKMPNRLGLILSWHVLLPIVTKLYCRFPGKRLGQSTDIPSRYITQWSKRWRNADLAAQLSHYGVRPYFNKISFPIIHINATDDPIATPKAVERFSMMLPNANQTYLSLSPEVYGPIGHFDLFKRKFKQSIWLESLQWIKSLESIR